jgi:low molecular weight phosphotyrosine protein phosphatase
MDEENLYNLNRIKPKGSSATVKLLGSFDPNGMLIVEDPYYGGTEGFETNFQQVTRSCNAFIDFVKNNESR